MHKNKIIDTCINYTRLKGKAQHVINLLLENTGRIAVAPWISLQY